MSHEPHTDAARRALEQHDEILAEELKRTQITEVEAHLRAEWTRAALLPLSQELDRGVSRGELADPATRALADVIVTVARACLDPGLQATPPRAVREFINALYVRSLVSLANCRQNTAAAEPVFEPRDKI